MQMALSPLGSAVGAARVIEPVGVLPQAAQILRSAGPLGDDETRIAVSRLNLDAASFRQLQAKHAGRGEDISAEVAALIAARGKMHNPVTGSGGMLLGTITEVGPQATHGLRVGDRVATLVSLTLTPLRIDDELRHWDGLSEQVPTTGEAIVFGRTIVARLPVDLPEPMALAALDVCGAPALTQRLVEQYLAHRGAEDGPLRVMVIGAGGKSGAMALAAARGMDDDSGSSVRITTIGVVPNQAEAQVVHQAALADQIITCDARDPLRLTALLHEVGGSADLTVVCVDVPGCEAGAILGTRDGGTIIFFSMATSFPAAALGAEGVAADVTMLIGNGYLPGHAELALGLLRNNPGVRSLYELRLREELSQVSRVSTQAR